MLGRGVVMSMPIERKNPPDTLADLLGDLDVETLRSVYTYVEQRLDNLQSSMEEQIRSEAEGEIIDIKDVGPYTLVWKYHPSCNDGKVGLRSLYRVKRERQIDGTETLHWSYLGEAIGQSNAQDSNHNAVTNGCDTTRPRYDKEADPDRKGGS